MKVYNNIHSLPVFKNAVITIGTFDGVHRGHQQILEQLIKEATAIDGTAVLITFYPHPKQVVSLQKGPLYIINTPEEKYDLLHRKGIEHIVVVPFDTAFAEQTATSYIKDFLADKFHPHTIIIGYDHRFGNNRKGDYHLLEQEAETYNFKVKEIPEHVLKNITVSSTKIRASLLQGDLETATAYLGYSYFFSGKVILGNQLGRTLGFPTANLQVQNEQKLIPANGVYAVKIAIKGRDDHFTGMMNIGVRPTVDGSTRVIEVNIFDFDEMIYDSTLTITLVKYLRREIKFVGLDELKAQLVKDKENEKTSFKN